MRYIVSILLCAMSSLLFAQRLTVRDAFVSMPDSLLTVLSTNNRLDMIDFYDNGMEAKVKNAFDDVSVLTKLTDRDLCVTLSPCSQMEMRMLQMNDSTEVIGLVRTYVADGAESDVSFYDAEWRPTDRVGVKVPDVMDFFATPDSIPADVIATLREMPMMSCTWTETGDALEYTLHLTALDRDQKAAVADKVRRVVAFLEVIRKL